MNVINTNIGSMKAANSANAASKMLGTAMERLSTGKRINSAKDDAAGLAITTSMTSQVRGMNQGIRNANDGISMVQIAEGTLDEVTTILQRMRDLAVQASNGSLSTTEQGYLDSEHAKLATSLGQAIDQAKFNGTDLVSDTAQTTITIHSGADASDTTTINFKALTEQLLSVDATVIDLDGTASQGEVTTISSITVADEAAVYTLTVDGVVYTSASTDANMNTLNTALMAATADDGTVLGDLFTATNTGTTGASGNLVLTRRVAGDRTTSDFTLAIASGGSTNFAAGSDATTTAGTSQATDAITAIDAALATVASERATLGATQAQLESQVRNLANVAENTSAAAGRIMDTDYAAETANLTKAQILQQAATSVLAQANAQPQAVLALLQ